VDSTAHCSAVRVQQTRKELSAVARFPVYRKSTDLFQFAKFARILQWSLFEIPAVAVVLVMQFAIVFMYAYSRNLLEMFVENNVGYPIISMTPKAESDLERNEY